MNQAGSAAWPLPERRNTGSRPLTETERNWLRTAVIVVGSVLLFAGLYQVEMNMGRWKDSIRFVLDPMESSMRYLSLSHFFVAGVYMFSSRRMKSRRALLEAAGMLALGLLLCAGYARLETASIWIAGLLFFVFFLVHDFRDQVFFYQANGDAPADRDPKKLSRAVFLTPFLLLAVLYCLASPAVASGALWVSRVSDTTQALSRPARWAVALLPAAILAAAFPILRRKFEGANMGSFRTFLTGNRPIFFVFAGGLLLWTLGEIATGLPNTIVLIHVVSWYIFTDRLLRKRVPEGSGGPFSWAKFRNTTIGFRVLHLGSAALLVALGIVWAYGYSNDPSMTPFRVVLAPENFRYWTILHVTVSFAGR